jgi:cysteine desulfurase
MLHFLSSKGIFVSSGSACSSNSQHVSSALVAFGRTPDEADHSLRISLSHRNELSDIDALCEALEEGLTKLARVKR